MKKRTKKWRIEKAREIIDRNHIDVPFPVEDLIDFSDVVELCVDGAIRKVNPQFPSDPRHLHTLIDGKWEAPESEVKRVMRFLIRDDLADFMSCIEPKECAYCGAVYDLTVDHVDPPFNHIAKSFMKIHGLPEVVDNPDTGMVTKCFADFNIEAQWIAYHAENACYQVLCRSCNARKGTGQTT